MRIRRLVDKDLSHVWQKPITPIFGFIPLGIAALLEFYLHPMAATVAWVVAIAAGSGWMAFLLWRAWRLFKAYSVRSDRSFDQRDKFTLAAEYHHSDSASRTRKMRNARRRRAP